MWRVVRDGVAVDDVVCTTFWSSDKITLSADGDHYGYPCFIEGADGSVIIVIIDGIQYGSYNNVWGIRFSGDGTHFAYVASDGTNWAYYLDGQPFDLQYDDAWPPQFSEDGTRILWKAKRGEEAFFLAIDGTEIAGDFNALFI